MESSSEIDAQQLSEAIEAAHKEIMREMQLRILKALGRHRGRSEFIYKAIRERRKERQGQTL